MTTLDDLWLRDGDERFARFLRRLGFDHDEARVLAQKTRPPTEILSMKDGTGFVEHQKRPEKKCICLNVTGHSIYCPANPRGRAPYPSADPANNIPVQGPEYDGPPMIVNDEREITDMTEPRYRA